MHIRRTDHKACIENSPDYIFYNKIDELISINKDVRIFLCTDDPYLKHDMLNRYENNIFSRETKKRYDIGGFEDGVIDMFLLSKCQMIYGAKSGFC